MTTYIPVTLAASSFRVGAHLALLQAMPQLTLAQIAEARAVIERQAMAIDEEAQQRAGQLLLDVAGAEVVPHEDVSAAGNADPDYWTQVGPQWGEVR